METRRKVINEFECSEDHVAFLTNQLKKCLALLFRFDLNGHLPRQPIRFCLYSEVTNHGLGEPSSRRPRDLASLSKNIALCTDVS